MTTWHSSPGLESGTNLTRVKDYNQVVVLDLIRSRGALTRPAIAEATGLTLQTVSNITRRLLETAIVAEVVGEREGGGRAHRHLRINADGGFAIGMQLEREVVHLALIDLAGDIRAQDVLELVGEPPARAVVHIARRVDTLIEGAGVDRLRVLGAGLGVPGPLDLGAGRLLSPISFLGWRDFALREALTDALALPVIMDNDATAAALGEQWRGLGIGVQNLVYLYMGAGVGAGLILDGQAFRGRHGNTGEISHIQADPDGPVCECGAIGCLSLYTNEAGILREARRAVLEVPPGTTPPPFPDTLADVVGSDVALFNDVVQASAAKLAKTVVEMTQILEPELIVLGGPLTEHIGEAFREAIRLRLALLDGPGIPPPRIELSQIGSDAGVIGAATLVLHHLYTPTLGKLSLAQ